MKRFLFVAAALLASRVFGAEPADIVIADFEGETYGQWKTTGDAFGPGPARGTLPNQMHVDGFNGKGLANSFYKGDNSTGTLTSPEFKIERRYIKFLIGGGKDPAKLRLDLLVEGKVVRSATGLNDRPGGSETLAAQHWDVAEFSGKLATLQIVDQATGGWGHINVDDIIQTDTKPAAPLVNVKRDFKIEKRFLNIPIKNGAAKRIVTLLVEGMPAVKNEIELADAKPDWWAAVDVSAWRGKTMTLEINRLAENSKAVESIEQSDSIRNPGDLYREPMRGQFHFSSQRGWLNDPNGLVYFNGEYHLFYQHNPYGRGWGNMHWGHSVSKDMVHWEELGDALMPDNLGAMFSGSAVVDWNNTSGFGQGGKPPLVLIYTAAGNPTVQCIASSIDGRNFTKYANNPVVAQIAAGNRDPKVFWHEPSKKWVMVLYVEQNVHAIHFFTSPNLREWTLASVIKGGSGNDRFLFECPDFFELPIDGDASKKKWVLMAANSEYAIGNFDGNQFTPDATKLPGHRGQGYYAAQTFSDIPSKDGRRIQIGWFQTDSKVMPFNQSMSIPHELRLISTADGPRLTWTPVKELESLRGRSHKIEPLTLSPESANPLEDMKSELVELRAGFEPGETAEVTFNVRGAAIIYDAKKQELAVNKHRVAVPMRDGKQNLTVYCDRNGLEIFFHDGLVYMPMPFAFKTEDLSLSVHTTGGNVHFSKLQVQELNSAWK